MLNYQHSINTLIYLWLGGFKMTKKISCITLIKADELTGFVNEFLGPVMNVMLKNKD